MSDRAEADRPRRRRIALIASGVAVAVVLAAGTIFITRDRTQPYAIPPSFLAAVHRGAILGAPEHVFDHSLGKGNLQSQMMGDLKTFGYARCPSDGNAQFSVTFAAGRAIAIAWSPCGSAPPSTDALAMGRQMLPSDATPDAGSSDRFTSSTLASSIDRSWFEDCSGNEVPAGTVSMSVTSKNGFDVTVGTCTNAG